MTKNPNFLRELDLGCRRRPDARGAGGGRGNVARASAARAPVRCAADFGAAAHELGGYEARPVELVRAIATLAAADGSTAWCAAIAAGGAYFGGLLPRAGAQQVFANPDG